MPHEHFTFGPFMLDMDRGMLSREGRPVAVGQKGLLLLQAFLRSPGKILDKASLMDVAWPGLAVEESNLSVQIAALSKLLSLRMTVLNGSRPFRVSVTGLLDRSPRRPP
jgi:DNA-binding winged helix-turn-helix (wHTH) protein